MDNPYPLVAAIAAYLIGSLSFAVIVTKLMGLSDPRTYGSKNPGATNVLRSGNKPAAIVTLLLDALKGFLPMFLVSMYGTPYGMEEGTVAMVAVAAFLGHLYPLYFGFKGGKGVATALGVLFGISWALGLATLATWVIIAFFFRYSSLASIVSAVFAPIFYIIGDGAVWDVDQKIAAAILVMSALLLYRHWGNILRLVEGKESRIGAKKSGTSRT